MKTLDTQRLLKRYLVIRLSEAELDLLLEELPLAEKKEPGFLQRNFDTIQAGTMVGDEFVIPLIEGRYPTRCGCAYGSGTGLSISRCIHLIQEVREELQVGQRLGGKCGTPLQWLVARVRYGDTPRTNPDLALLEELLLHFLTNKEESEVGA